MATSLKSLSDFSHTEVPSAAPFRFGIVTAQWNVKITGALLEGALKALTENGAKEENIISITVPGSYELISGADLLLTNKDVDAVICLGCVIQGDTPHFDYICSGVAHGLANVGIKHTKPVIFGVLTTNTELQAEERAGGKHGNKGEEAAVTAIIMSEIGSQLKQSL